MVMALLRRWLYTPIIIWQGDWIPRDYANPRIQNPDVAGFPFGDVFCWFFRWFDLGPKRPSRLMDAGKKTPWWNRLRGGLHNFLSYTICVEMILQLDYIMYVTVWIYSLYIHILRRNYAYGLKILHYTYIMRFGNFHTMTQRYKIYIFVVDPKNRNTHRSETTAVASFFSLPSSRGYTMIAHLLSAWTHVWLRNPMLVTEQMIPSDGGHKMSSLSKDHVCLFFVLKRNMCFFFPFFFPLVSATTFSTRSRFEGRYGDRVFLRVATTCFMSMVEMQHDSYRKCSSI